MIQTKRNRLAPYMAYVNNTIERLLTDIINSAPFRDHPLMSILYKSIFDYLSNSGKRMHGVSMLLAYKALSGNIDESVLPIVAGYQLYHHHCLVHDDIYDGDEKRRNVSTVHHGFYRHFADGTSQTNATKNVNNYFSDNARRQGVIAGFAQGKVVHAIAIEMIMRAHIDSASLLAVSQELNQHDLYDNAGQMLDVYHEGLDMITPEECLKIAEIKTARLFESGIRSAAIAAKTPPEQCKALVHWASYTALAYQLKDDLEDIESDSEKGMGRRVGVDLLSCKPTYLFSQTLMRADPIQKRILRNWISGKGETKDIPKIIEIVKDSGAYRACSEKISEYVDMAKSSINQIKHDLPAHHRMTMEYFVDYFVSDEYWKRPLSEKHNTITL